MGAVLKYSHVQNVAQPKMTAVVAWYLGGLRTKVPTLVTRLGWPPRGTCTGRVARPAQDPLRPGRVRTRLLGHPHHAPLTPRITALPELRDAGMHRRLLYRSGMFQYAAAVRS
jgi:hypothetical protein